MKKNKLTSITIIIFLTLTFIPLIYSPNDVFPWNYLPTNNNPLSMSNGWSNIIVISDDSTAWNVDDSEVPRIATDNNGNIHVVWHDLTNGEWGTDMEILYANYTASGWSNVTCVSDYYGWNIGNSIAPDIAVDNDGNIHVVWYDDTNGEWGMDSEIMYANRTAAGWSNATVISDDGSGWNIDGSYNPSITVDNSGNIHVVWDDTTDGEWGTDDEIFYANYTANGWSNGTCISDPEGWNNQLSVYPSIATDLAGNVHVAWYDETDGEWGTDTEIMYVNYTSSGWSNLTAISDIYGWNDGQSYNPSIANDNMGNIHVVWEDYTDGEWGVDVEVLYTNYTASGWSNATCISDDEFNWNIGSSVDPHIVTDSSGTVHVVWGENTDGEWGIDQEVMYVNYTAAGWANVTVISDNASGWNDGHSAKPCITVDKQGGLHVVWQDGTNGTWGIDKEIMYTKRSPDNQPPISNQPNDILTHKFGSETINWILYDGVGPGKYRVWANDTNDNYYIWVNWTSWSNNTPLNIPINRTALGIFNYTIEYNDSLSLLGIPDYVFVSIFPGWSNVTIISDNETGWNNDNSWMSEVAIDNNGNIHVVWEDYTDGIWGSDTEIMYVNYTASGWSDVKIISDDYTGWNNGQSSRPAIATDYNGNLHLVWQDSTSGEWGTDFEIMYANYTAKGWSNATVISDDFTGWNDDFSEWPSIATDNNGNIHVVWCDTTSGEWGTDLEIMYANYTGTGWSNATVISDDYTGWNNGSSQYPDIATDNNGNIHVVWYDDTNGSWGIDTEIMYTNYTGSGWFNATVISDDYTGWNDDISQMPSIAVDNIGNVHVVWFDQTNGEWGIDAEIMYTNYTGSNWTNISVISDVYGWNDGVSYNPSIDTDNNGNLHVVWEDETDGEWGTDREIMYTKYTITGWSNTTVISDDFTGWNNEFSFRPSIAIDISGAVHVVWHDYTNGTWGTDTEIMYSGYYVENLLPTSNQPNDITTYKFGSETIDWILYDDVGPGKYRVWTNDTNNNYHVWKDWTSWSNNTPLNIDINRTALGVFNYTIEFNDSSDLFGNPDTIIVRILAEFDWANATVISDEITGWNTGSSNFPCVAVGNNGVIHAVWEDATDGEWGTDTEIMYANYTASAGWSNATVISDNASGWNVDSSYVPSIAVDNEGNVHVVWEDYTNGAWGTDIEIMYIKYNSSSGWSDTIAISDYYGWNDGNSNAPTVAVDNSGNVHVVWQDDTDGEWGTDREIMYTNYTVAGWANATVVSDDYTGWNLGDSIDSSVTVGDDGIIHVVWSDATVGEWGGGPTDYEIMYTNCSASGWINATAISDVYGWNDGVSSNPSIDTDLNGNAHIVWDDDTDGEWGIDKEIMYANHRATGWSNATVISDDDTAWNIGLNDDPIISIDAYGLIHVIWSDETDGEWGTDDEIMYVNYASSWSNVSVISDDNTGWNNGDSDNPSLCVDNTGTIHAVWHDHTNGWWGLDAEIMYSQSIEIIEPPPPEWSNATVISDDYTGWNIDTSSDPEIAIDKNGNVHVVWADGTNGEWGSDLEIMYVNYTASGWSNATCISDIYGWNWGQSYYPSIATDSDGNIHVVWSDGTSGEWGTDLEIMYANYTGAGWSNATVISDDYTGWNNGSSQAPDIATDNIGNIYVVWYDYTNGEWGTDIEIMLANYTGSGWSNATVISDDSSRWNNDTSSSPSIAIDPNGNVHVVWNDETDGEWGNDTEIMYANYTASGWSNATAISDIYGWNNEGSWWPSIATDNNGNIHVVWHDFTNGEWGTDTEIMYTNYTITGWSNATVISDVYGWNDLTSRDSKIATDNNGNIHVVWDDDTVGEWGGGSIDREIMYVKYTTAGWSNATVISDDSSGWNNDISQLPSIALDINGNIHIVWQDDTNGTWGIDTEIMYTNYTSEKPNIISVLREPTDPTNLDSVNITAHITDNTGVDIVLIKSNYTGSPIDYEMELFSGNNRDGYWNYTIPAYPAGTTINYSIWANNTNNNYEIDGPYQYTIGSSFSISDWSNVTVISDDYTGWNIDSSYNPSIATDNNGNIHVVWDDATDGEWGPDAEIMYANYTAAGWSNATAISDIYGWNTGGSYDPSIAIDTSGNIHVVWYDGTDGEWGTDIEIMYANYTAAGWSNATVISDDYTGWNIGDSQYPNIAVDNNGNIHVVWNDGTIGEWGTDIEVMYVNHTSAGWSNVTVISDDYTGWNDDFSWYPSIATDPAGNLHVTWYDSTNGEWGMDNEIMYVNYTSTGWSNVTVISDDYTGWNDGSSIYPSIITDNAGVVHVVWQDFTWGEWGNDREIMYVNYTAAGWSNATCISDLYGWNNDSSMWPRITTDSFGYIHVVWYDETDGEWGIDREIMYVNYTAAGWSNATVISDDVTGWNIGASSKPSIATNTSGSIHVVWHDETDGEWGSDIEIMYARTIGIGENQPPTSNSPGSILTTVAGSETIGWILYDDFGSGQYRVWANDTNDNYYVWQNWQNWANNTSLDVLINRTAPGVYNYTIEYYDMYNLFGNPDTVIITITSDQWVNATVISDDYTGWNIDNSYNPSIATDSNGNIHVVWMDHTDGEWGTDQEIMYANYTGSTWSNITVISDDYTGWNVDSSWYPSIAIDSLGNIHVVWQDVTDGEWGADSEIMYVNYTSSGWSNVTVISDIYGWNSGSSSAPCIVTDNNNNLHVVWADDTNGEWGSDLEIMYINYTAAGWSNATCISDLYGWNNNFSTQPSIDIDNNGNIHVVWQDDTDGEWGIDDEIMYVNYTTVTGWSNATVVSDDATGWNNETSAFPQIAIDGNGDVHVVWEDWTRGEWGNDREIMYAIYTITGWSNATIISDNSSGWNDGDSIYPSIVMDNNDILHVVWADSTDNPGGWGFDLEIMYTKKVGLNWSNVIVISDDYTTWNIGQSNNPCITSSNNGMVHVVWNDNTDGEWGNDWEIMYMRGAVFLENQPPTSNNPNNITILANGSETIDWILYDDFGPYNYRVWVNDTNDNYYLWVTWTAWLNNTPLNVPINRTAPGVYNYTIEFYDAFKNYGIPDMVIVTITNVNPTSNSPGPISTTAGGSETIGWRLYDDFAPGQYRVWANDTNDYYYVLQDWQIWVNDTSLDVLINRTAPGVYNYTIVFYDNYSLNGTPNTVIVTVQNLMPTSNQPINITTSSSGNETIDWILWDDFGPGQYRIWSNGSVWVDWTTWTNNTPLNIPIDRNSSGYYNYTIEYNDLYNLMGIPDEVNVTVIQGMPTAYSPADITTYSGDIQTINWTLYDDFEPGQYRVWANDTNDNYYIWQDWQTWTNNTPLDVSINRTSVGFYNYTIEYYDNSSKFGKPDTVFVNITGNIGKKQYLSPGFNLIYQYDDDGFLWINMSIYVSVETNITLTTNLTQPANFANFTDGNVSVFYEITLDNPSALDNTTIRFHYNESLLGGTLEVNLAIYIYNETAFLWEMLNSTIDYNGNYTEITLYQLSQFVLAPKPSIEKEGLILFPPPGAEDQLLLYIIIGGIGVAAAVVIGIGASRRKGPKPIPKKKPPKIAKWEKLIVKRAYDYVGGNIRFKVVVRNNTRETLRDISVLLNVKKQFELDSTIQNVDILDPKESRGIDFMLTPLTCGTSTVEADVSYEDSTGAKFSTIMEPSLVQVKCPLVQPKPARLEDLKVLRRTLQKSHSEIKYSELDISYAFQIAREQISSLDVSEVDLDEETHNVVYSGEAKIGGEHIIIDLRVIPNVIIIDVYLKDLKQATGFLAYIKNLINLAITYSSQIVTTLDRITAKINNAFEFGQRLSELYNLCDRKEPIDEILLLLKELNIKANSYFPDLELSEPLGGWINNLEKIMDKEIWERTYINIQFDTLIWMELVITFSKIQTKSYFESPSINEETREKIEWGNTKLLEELKIKNEDYSKKILFALMLINKVSGISMYNHNFKETALDSDLIGGFLTAIQSFGEELSKEHTAMRKLSYEHFEIELVEGEFTRAALITLGFPDELTVNRLHDFIRKFEAKYKTYLEQFIGDVSKFRGAKELVEEIFLKE